MKRKKQFATIHKIDSDTITIKINDSPSTTAKKSLARGIVKVASPAESKVSMYRRSSQHKRGVLGIKYIPSYYIGDVHIEKTNDPDQFLIKKSHIAGSKLSVGDVVVVEATVSKKEQTNQS